MRPEVNLKKKLELLIKKTCKMEIGSSYLLSNKIFLVKQSEKLVPKLEDHKKYPYLINDTLQRTLVLFSWVKKSKMYSPSYFLIRIPSSIEAFS